MQLSTRRDVLNALGAFLAGSPLLRAQQDPFRDHTRVPGMNELLTTFDFEAVAYAKQPRLAYDYPAYGADSEFTLRRNREAFDWVELIPKRIGAAATPDTAIELFGTKMAFPLIVSPTAGHGQLHPDGEMATHKGAHGGFEHDHDREQQLQLSLRQGGCGRDQPALGTALSEAATGREQAVSGRRAGGGREGGGGHNRSAGFGV